MLPSPVWWTILLKIGVGTSILGGLLGIACRTHTQPIWRGVAAAALFGGVSFTTPTVVAWLLPLPDYARLMIVMLSAAAGGAGCSLVLRDSWVDRLTLSMGLTAPFAALSLHVDHGRSFAAAGLGLAAAAISGRALWELLRLDRTAIDRIAGTAMSLRLIGGFMLLSTFGFALGVLHLLHHWVILGSLLLVPVVGLPLLQKELRLVFFSTNNPPPHPWSGWTIGLVWSTLFIAWMCALAPEVGPDALGGRQAIPRMWIEDHQLAAYPEMLLSYMAAAGETLFLMLLPLASEQAAKIGQFLAWISLVPATLQLLGRRQSSSLLLMLAFWTSTVVLVQFAWGFVDMVQLSFYIGALIAGGLWYRCPQRGLLVLAGLLAGAATAVKLNGLGSAVILGAVIFVKILANPEHRSSIVCYVFCLAGGVLLIFGPWSLRSYLLSGNPVFPYANSIFMSPMAPLELTAKRFGDAMSFNSFVQIPWRVIMNPGQFAEIGSYHPMLLIALPFVALSLLHRASRYWTLMGLAAGSLWFVTEQNLRYSLFAAYALTLGSAIYVDRTLSLPGWRRFSLMSGIAMGIWVVGFYASISRPSAWLFLYPDQAAAPLSVVSGHLTKDSYLSAILPHYPLLRKVDELAGTSAKVWEVPFLRDHLHLKGRAISLPHCDYRLAKELVAVLNLVASPEAVVEAQQRLRELGITHILLSPESPWAPRQPGGTRSVIFSEEFRETVARVEYANLGFVLLSLPRAEETLPPYTRGSNLLVNPDLVVAEDSFYPLGWAPSGVFPDRSRNGLVLPAGYTLYQRAQIERERLYRFEINFDPEYPSHGAYLHGAWLGEDGRLLAYHNYAMTALNTPGRIDFYQTAPDKATQLDLTLRGPIAPRSISLQPVIPSTNLTP